MESWEQVCSLSIKEVSGEATVLNREAAKI